jgi:hypothetical protein
MYKNAPNCINIKKNFATSHPLFDGKGGRVGNKRGKEEDR